MRCKNWGLFSLALGSMICSQQVAFCAQDSTTPAASAPAPTKKNLDKKSELTEINREIDQLREQRRICQLRADYAGREAQRILTLDWVGYKHYTAMQGRYLDIIKDIDEKIKKLEERKKILEASSS